MMGHPEVPLEEHVYKWLYDKLWIRMEPFWLEYPTVRRRRLIVENTHMDNVHIGGVKMAKRIKKQYYWETIDEDCRDYAR